MKISALPHTERPRERCLEHGPETLSLRECVAVILGTGPRGKGCLGTAEEIVDRPGKGLSGYEQEHAFFLAMESLGENYLKNIGGLGPAGRSRLLAAMEFGKRYHQYVSHRDPQRTEILRFSLVKKRSLAAIPPKMRAQPKEWLGFIPVFQNGKVGELCLVEKGVRTHVNTDRTEFFSRLLSLRPAAFFLAHNHPSGECEPSQEDVMLTASVKQLSSEFSIELLGHWIVSPSSEHLF